MAWTEEQKAAASARAKERHAARLAKKAEVPEKDPPKQVVKSESFARPKRKWDDTPETHYLKVGHIPEDWGLGNPVDTYLDEGYTIVEERKTETIMSIPQAEYRRRVRAAELEAIRRMEDQGKSDTLSGGGAEQTTNVVRSSLVSAEQALGA